MMFASAVSFAQKPIATEAQLQQFLEAHSLTTPVMKKHTLERQQKTSQAKPIVSLKAAPYDLVSKQPEGTLKTYVGNLGGYYSIYGYILPAVDNGRAVDVVYGTDGCFYLKNPFSEFATGTWLKGSIEGDTITFAAQPIYYEAADEAYDEMLCYAAKMTYGYVEDYGQNYWSLDLDDSSVKMVTRNDSIILVNDHGYTALGLFYEDGEWTGFGEYRKILTEQTDTPVTLPETAAEGKEYVMSYGIYETGADTLSTKQQLVTLYKDGNDCYLTDLTGTGDGIYAKGTLADGKMTMESGQYMGLSKTEAYNAARYFDYFQALGWKRVATYGNSYEDSTYAVKNITFDYDEAADRYTGENNYMAVNGGNTKVNVVSSFKKPVLTPYVEVKEAPAQPGIHSVEDMYEDYGYSYIEALLTNTTANGDFLDTRRIYYNIAIDDEEMTFYSDEYVNVEDEMTDVPYSFVDNEDFQTYKGRRVIYIFKTGFNKVTLTEYFVDSDGVKHYSEPAVWMSDAYKADVKNMLADKTTKATRYYDLSGRAVSNPAPGIYVKATTYTDGTTKMKKVVVNK